GTVDAKIHLDVRHFPSFRTPPSPQDFFVRPRVENCLARRLERPPEPEGTFPVLWNGLPHTPFSLSRYFSSASNCCSQNARCCCIQSSASRNEAGFRLQ